MSDPERDYTRTSVVVVEGNNATQHFVDATPRKPFVEEILEDRPMFVGSWQNSCGVVLLAGESAQRARVLPKALKLPPADERREADIYGKAVAVRTDESGDVLDLSLDEFERLCAVE